MISSSLIFSLTLIAISLPLDSTALSQKLSEEYQSEEFKSCVNRVEKTRTATPRGNSCGIKGSSRCQKTDRFKFAPKTDVYSIEAHSVRLEDIHKIGSGRGCYDLDLLQGINGEVDAITFTAHARSDGVGTRGVQECKLSWRECND